MKLFFLTPLLFIAFLSIFTFSTKLNHVQNVFLSMPKSTFMASVVIEEATQTPRFHYQRTCEAVERYFTSNIKTGVTYEYILYFIDKDANEEVFDNRGNELRIDFSASLIFHDEYQQALIISLGTNYA
ncbi:MAG: hypothetical protein AB7E23_00425 [Bacilli bacterium]